MALVDGPDRAQWAATLGLLPLLLALGLPVSASGPLANLLAVPWVSLTVPFALLGTLLLPLAGLAKRCCRWSAIRWHCCSTSRRR